MRTTQELRVLWSPACKSKLVRVHFGEAYISIDNRCEEAFKALASVFDAFGYTVRMFNTKGEIVTGAYNCRKITGGSGYSLHAYAIAGDFNTDRNPYGPKLITDMPRSMVEAVLAIRTKEGKLVFGWGGNYKGNKDAMHYEIVASPVELRKGIDWNTVAIKNERMRELFKADGWCLVRPLRRDGKGRFATWAWTKDGTFYAFNGAPAVPNATQNAAIARPIHSMEANDDGDGYVIIAGDPDSDSGISTYHSKDFT